MSKKHATKMEWWEIFAPFWMLVMLAFVSGLFEGVYSNSKYQMIVYGTQARLIFLCMIPFWMQFYIYEVYKIYHKVYRIIFLVLVVMIIMFFGCIFFSWWNRWMVFPLTAVWYPVHYRILKNLPRKDSDGDKK